MLTYKYKSKNILLIVILLFVSTAMFGQSVYTVGASGYMYTTIEAAYTAVPATPTGGYVIELQSNYNPASEAFPITLGAKAGASAANYIRITVANGVNETVTGNDATAIFDFNQADYVTIDGSPGSLTINNTNTGGATILFSNNATYNTIRNCTVTGRYNAALKGVIYFGPSGSVSGNNNNTITECNITSDGANYARVLMLSDGDAARPNNNNIISDNNFYDWHIANTLTYAIYIIDNSNSWEISGNSFYRTSSYTVSDNHVVYAIRINSATINGFTISGNYIGGNSPQCNGTWTQTSTTTTGRFRGIYIIAGTTSKTTVSANVIKNINWSSDYASDDMGGTFSAIWVEDGDVDIGSSPATGNIIGDNSTSSIQVNSGGGITKVYGILSESDYTRNISYNSIGSFTLTGTSTARVVPFDAINYTADASATSGRTFNITHNTIGSNTTANSIHLNVASVSANNQYMRGIVVNLAGYDYGTFNLNDNTIANMTNASNSADEGHYTRAIECYSTEGTNVPYFNIENNVIHSISSSSQSEGSQTTANMNILHIRLNSYRCNIVGNLIYNISNTTTANQSVVLTAIYYETLNSVAGSILINRNRIYDLYLSAGDNTARINGLECDEGSATLINNMIGLGYNVSGDYDIRGMHLRTSEGTATTSYYYNSIAIGGTVSSGSHGTFCFVNSFDAPVFNWYNNIVTNERSGGSGNHVSFYTVTKTGGFNSNYNCLFSNDTNTVVWYGANDATGASGAAINTGGGSVLTFAGWQALSLTPDANSLDVYVEFIDPEIGDFHTTACQVKRKGTPIAGITTDYDQETRDLTNPDMGADEAETYCWMGTVSTAWTTAGNWDDGTVPTSADYAVIPRDLTNYPIIETNVEVNGLNIETGGSLTVNPGASITVDSLLRNKGTINIKSTASGCGCLKNETSLLGDGTLKVERYVTGGSHKPYHYISVPLKDQPYWKIRYSGDYVPSWYDETVVNTDLDYGWTAVRSGNLTVGRGYAVVSQYASRTFNFTYTGTNPLETLPFNKSVTWTATTGGPGWAPKNIDPQGWNLIGNPFACPMDADEFLTDNAAELDATYGAVYFWDDLNGTIDRSQDYAAYTLLGGTGTHAATGNSSNIPNGIVLNGQGFFIKVKNTSSSVVFNGSQRTGSSSTQFFIPDMENQIGRFWLGIYNPDQIYNEILIGFTPFATMGVDHLWDARKMKGNPKIALYSLINNVEYAIQALPYLDEDLWVELGIDIWTAGTHTFKVAGMENLNIGNGIYLLDKYTNILTNLITNPEYQFTSAKGVFKDRFRLIFTPATSVNNGGNFPDSLDNDHEISASFTDVEENPVNDLLVFKMAGNIVIQSPESFESTVSLYDASGKLILDRQTQITENTILAVPELSKGIYLIRITSGEAIITRKIVF